MEPTPEFSRIVDVDALDAKGVELHLKANDDELAALTERYGIEAVRALEATVRIRPVRGDEVLVDMDFSADVLQSCVVTLEPVAAIVRDSVSLRFVRGGSSASEMMEFDPEAADAPEPLEEGPFDVGELVAQYVSLAIDPYPRAAGVSIADILPEAAEEVVEDETGERSNPFAVLAGRFQRPAE